MDHHRHHDEGHVKGQSRGGIPMEHMGMGHAKPIFEWAKAAVPVFFQQWTTGTIHGLALAMLTAAALGAGYEWLRNWMSRWDNTQRGLQTMTWWKRLYFRCFRSVLHALSAAVGYLQMLLAMTYDLRLLVAVILGCGLGFFVLGPYFRGLSDSRRRNNANNDVIVTCVSSINKDRRGPGVGGEGQRLVEIDEDVTELLPTVSHPRRHADVYPKSDRPIVTSSYEPNSPMLVSSFDSDRPTATGDHS